MLLSKGYEYIDEERQNKIIEAMKNPNWVVITDLVDPGLWNIDGIRWGLTFSRFVSKERKAIRGGVVAYMHSDGTIKVKDRTLHRVIISDRKDEDERSLKDSGTLVFLENLNHPDSRPILMKDEVSE